jgi:hypothetical protein
MDFDLFIKDSLTEKDYLIYLRFHQRSDFKYWSREMNFKRRKDVRDLAEYCFFLHLFYELGRIKILED